MARISCALLACLLSLPCPAATVYRWVDEQGVTSYSDAPPAAGSRELQQLQLDVPDASPDPKVAARQAAMSSLADRLAADRRQREEQVRTRAAAVPSPVVVVERHYSRPVYPGWQRRQPSLPAIPDATEQPRFPRNLPSPNWPGPVKRWGFD